MSRMNLDNADLRGARFLSASLGHLDREIVEDLILSGIVPPLIALEPIDDERSVLLPAHAAGDFYYITNSSDEFDLVVKDAAAVEQCRIPPGHTATLWSISGGVWRNVVNFANLKVFGGVGAGHSIGLVPDPGLVGSGARFLREDGQWADAGTGGITTDAFSFFRAGATTVPGTGNDTLTFRSSDNSIALVAGANDPTFGDNLDLVVDPTNVDHDALLNFVANEHIDHSSVAINSGSGLSGGGAITASRTISLALHAQADAASDAADLFGFYDVSAAAYRKSTRAALNAALEHDILTGFVANEHIDHSTVAVAAGAGLSGGGALTTSQVISLALQGLAALSAPLATDDIFGVYDTSESGHRRATILQVEAALGWTPWTTERRLISSRLNDEYNIKDKSGVLGLDVDESTAIQAAVTAAEADLAAIGLNDTLTGRSIVFPSPAVYRLTNNEIRISRGNVSLRGDAGGYSMIRARGTTIRHDLIRAESGEPRNIDGELPFLENTNIRDLHLSGFDNNTPVRGIVARRVSRGIFKDIIGRSLHIGISIQACARVMIDRYQHNIQQRQGPGATRSWAGIIVTNSTYIPDDTTGNVIRDFEADSNPLTEDEEDPIYSLRYGILVEASDGVYIRGGHSKAEFGCAFVAGGVVWEASRTYEWGDILLDSYASNTRHYCTVAHTADANPVTGFATDKALGRWVEFPEEGGIQSAGSGGAEVSGGNVNGLYCDKYSYANFLWAGSGTKQGSYQLANCVASAPEFHNVMFNIDPASVAGMDKWIWTGGVMRSARRTAIYDATGKVVSIQINGALVEDWNKDNANNSAAVDLAGDNLIVGTKFVGGSTNPSSQVFRVQDDSRLRLYSCDLSEIADGQELFKCGINSQLEMDAATAATLQ